MKGDQRGALLVVFSEAKSSFGRAALAGVVNMAVRLPRPVCATALGAKGKLVETADVWRTFTILLDVRTL